MSEPARKDVARVDEGAVIQADAGSIMAVIGRAAADPATDVDKLTKLVDLYDRISARTAEQVYSEAMNAAQEQMRPVAADANNPQTKSKYASYGALDKALRPIYTRHGFSISFDTADCPKDDHVRVVCKIAHSGGHREFPHLDMPADGKGAKGGDVMTKTHAIGAAVTYGKRYLLGMVFNIAVGDVEQDGNSNGGRDLGEAAKRAIEEINACEDAAALVLWKKTKSAGVMNVVSDAEGREIIALFNRRVAALKDAGDHG